MQNRLAPSRGAALRERGTVIRLTGCLSCGFVFNEAFDMRRLRYAADYDNTPDCSPRFRSYLLGLASFLYRRHRLTRKDVLEIGCGKGNFLAILRDLGARRLRGYDPAYTKQGSALDRIVVPKLFNSETARDQADFIICKETLEHIPKPRPFVRLAAEHLGPDGTMYFEVPNLAWTIREQVFFDFTYEHCNYFTTTSLAALFSSEGLSRVSFRFGIGGQYIGAEVRRGKPAALRLPAPREVIGRLSSFLGSAARRYERKLSAWGNFAVWGVAGKGVTFLNRLRIGYRRSPYAIDINPAKQGRFVPITGQEVVHPALLRRAKIDTIVIMNPIYKTEIRRAARSYGYRGSFVMPYREHESH